MKLTGLEIIGIVLASAFAWDLVLNNGDAIANIFRAIRGQGKDKKEDGG